MDNAGNLQEISDKAGHEINLEFIRRIVFLYKSAKKLDPGRFDQGFYKERAEDVIKIIDNMPESYHSTLSEKDKKAIDYANEIMRPKFSQNNS